MLSFPLVFLGVCGSILASYPYYQNGPQYVPNAPLYSQLNEVRNGPQYQLHKEPSAPLYQHPNEPRQGPQYQLHREPQYNPSPYLNTPPPYLIYPKAVYKLSNTSNEGYQGKGHDFILGSKGPRDELLLHSVVHKRPGFWRSYVTKEIVFPPAKSSIRVNITQVSAYDLGKKGTGGFVKVTQGGIGQENVTLLFTNQKDQPIYYELNIYGRKK